MQTWSYIPWYFSYSWYPFFQILGLIGIWESLVVESETVDAPDLTYNTLRIWVVGVFSFCLSAPHTLGWHCNIDMCSFVGPNSMFSCIHLWHKFGGRQYKYWINNNCTRIANKWLCEYVIMYVIDAVKDVHVLCRIVCLTVLLCVCIVTDMSVYSSITESSNWLDFPPKQMFYKCCQ